MGNLNNLYISQSFQSLAHLGTDTSLVPGTMTQLQDGIGQSLNIFFDGTNISSSGNIYGANITASVINTGSFVTTSSFNSYSQSVSSSLTNLSASLTITDTFLQQQITALDVSGAAVSLLLFNQFTASQLNINSGYNTFTSSTNVRLNNLESTTASINSSITQLNASSASQQVSINALNTATASLFISAGLAIVTASVVDDDITFTKGDGSTFTIQIATGSFALSASFAETASIARNLVIRARNGNDSTLPIGTVVHITSAVGDNPIFNTASYDTELLSANTLGVLRQSALSGADVEVVVQGTVTGVNTDPVLGYAAGDVIYLSSSGQFTNIQPQAPNQIVTLGQVLRAQQNNGSIYVAINNGWELNELHNVQINNPQTGDLIQYESSSYGLWKNKSIEGAGITTTSSFNSYTSSTDARLNSIEAATGSYATTGSNIFIGNQIITGSVTISSSAATDLAITGTVKVTSNNGLQVSTISPNAFNVGTTQDPTVNAEAYMFGSTASVSSIYVGVFDDPNFNTDVELKLSADSNGLSFNDWDNGSTFSYVPFMTLTPNLGNNPAPTFTRGLIVTGSTNIQNLTASLQQGYVWVGDSTGRTTTVTTASFATTGSNNFNGNQVITGSVTISGSATTDLTVVGQIFVSSSATAVATRPQITVSGSQGTTTIGRSSISTRNLLYQNLLAAFAIDNSVIGTGDSIGMTVSASVAGVAGWNLGPAIYVNNPGDTFPAVIGFQNKANYTDGRVAVLTPLSASAGFTASLQNGFTWVGNSLGQNTQVATSSFAGAINTGSFATTGSNFFNGNQTITGSLLVSGAFETTQDITIQDSTGNPTLKIGRGVGNQPSNLRFGVQALAGGAGLNNIAIGNSAMQYSSQSLATENIAIGGESLQYTQEGQQIAIGTSALRYTTTGKENLAFGAFAMENNITGNQNVAIGFRSLYSITSGSKNIAIGPSSGENFKSGSNNIFLGFQTGNSISGSNNVILGGYNGGGETINNNIILADGAGNKELQFSGSTWTTENNFVVSGSLSAANNIKMGRGVDKPTDKVTVGTGGLIVSNSLVTADSYIFATADTTVGNYSPVVSNITSGSFSLSNGGYAGNISVMYMIVNPY